MAKRIDLSFCTDVTSSDDDVAYSSTKGDVQDTVVHTDSDRAAVREKNLAELERLRVGQYTVAEMVRRLEQALDHRFYPSRIVQHEEETVRVFLELEQRQPSRTIDALGVAEPRVDPTICDITDNGVVMTDTMRRPFEIAGSRDQIFITFDTEFTTAPSVILGLYEVHTNTPSPPRGIPRVCPYVAHIHNHLFEVISEGSNSTQGISVGSTWLAVPRENPLLQVGNATCDDSGIMIPFDMAYRSAPKVIVWLNSFSMPTHPAEQHVIEVTVTDITPTGFRAYAFPSPNGSKESVPFSWFAYPADTPGICSGNLNPRHGMMAGAITFDKPFATRPRSILTALRKVEIYTSRYFGGFKVIQEALSRKGMAVRVQVLGDRIENRSNLVSIDVSYIAME